MSSPSSAAAEDTSNDGSMVDWRSALRDRVTSDLIRRRDEWGSRMAYDQRRSFKGEPVPITPPAVFTVDPVTDPHSTRGYTWSTTGSFGLGLIAIRHSRNYSAWSDIPDRTWHRALTTRSGSARSPSVTPVTIRPDRTWLGRPSSLLFGFGPVALHHASSGSTCSPPANPVTTPPLP
jgi:hypothetical protein